jgi:hypothetical protein
MQAIAPAAAGHGSASELVHDDDLLAPHDVVDIPDLQLLGFESIDQVGSPLLARVVQIRNLSTWAECLRLDAS